MGLVGFRNLLKSRWHSINIVVQSVDLESQPDDSSICYRTLQGHFTVLFLQLEPN